MSIRAAACAALAIQSVHAAQAQTANCMPAKEAEALILSIGSPFIEQLRTTCRSVLPADSYLIRRGGDLAARMGAAAAGREDDAVAAFKRFGDSGELDGMSSAMLLPLIKTMMGPMLAEEFKTKDCAGVNAILAPLDPLPAENLAGTLVAIIQLAEPGQAKSTGRTTKRSAPDFNICPLSTTP